MQQTQISSELVTLSSGTTMKYLQAGAGDAVVLLHGFPQTSTCWSSVMPLLAQHHTVIAPDLRGLGGTSIPPAATFDKKSLAAEVAELLVTHLGIDTFHVVGHDWGGVVAFSLAAHHRANVRTLTVVDVAIPSSLNPDMAQGGHRWHHGFHRTVGLPEALVQGREDIYLDWFFDNYGVTPDAISAEHRSEYIDAYRRPASLNASFEYYRATDQDARDNTRAALDDPVSVPVLAVGGLGEWGRGSEVRESLIPLVSGEIHERLLDGAGHWVPEEQPEALAESLFEHFERAR